MGEKRNGSGVSQSVGKGHKGTPRMLVCLNKYPPLAKWSGFVGIQKTLFNPSNWQLISHFFHHYTRKKLSIGCSLSSSLRTTNRRPIFCRPSRLSSSTFLSHLVRSDLLAWFLEEPSNLIKMLIASGSKKKQTVFEPLLGVSWQLITHDS